MLDYYFLKNQFLVRRPYFSLLNWYKLFEGDYEKNIYNLFINNETAAKALFNASPEFYNVLKNTEIQNLNKKTISTLAKYASRFSSRAIPFGYFCGVNVGSFDKDYGDTIVQKSKPIESYLLKLDNEVTFQIVDLLMNNDQIIKKIKFSSNPTFYKMGKTYKYIDYEYNNKQRRYVLNQLHDNSGIYRLIKSCEGWVNYEYLEKFYSEMGAEQGDILGYVRTLVQNKILFTNIHPCITKPDTLSHIEDELSESNFELIKDIREGLSTANPNGHAVEDLIKLQNYLKDNLKIKVKNYFQLDYVTAYDRYHISIETKAKIQEAVNFLCLLPNRLAQKHINTFIDKLKENYGTETVPLSEVLDASEGIGYPVGTSKSGSPYNMFESITFKNKKKTSSSFTWSWFDEVLLKKYLEFCRQGDKSFIKLSLEDIPKELRTSNCISQHLSVMAEIINSVSHGQLISLKGLGGKTPFQLMGRYSHLDIKIRQLLIDIAEEAKIQDSIQAEILLFPEDRLGNVTQHDPIFDYEIPIFSTTSVAGEKTVRLKDLEISVRDNKLILTSKKLKKRVYPRLCNAHIHDNTNIPAYRFLCDYENYLNEISSHSFSWPDIFSSIDHLPRVM